MNARSLIETFTVRHGPVRLPEFEQPSQIDASQVTLLGEKRGLRFYTHERYKCEFVASKLLLTDADVLPNRLLIVGTNADGERTYLPLSPVPAGSFEAASAAPSARPPKPVKPVDALGLVYLAGPKEERIVPTALGATLGPAAIGGPSTAPYIRPAAPAARGVAAIIERLRGKGATVALTRDGLHIIVTSAGGRAGPGVPELVAAAAPLILAHLQGHPLACVGDHKGVAPEAVTLALGGAPLCSECLGGAK